MKKELKETFKVWLMILLVVSNLCFGVLPSLIAELTSNEILYFGLILTVPLSTVFYSKILDLMVGD